MRIPHAARTWLALSCLAALFSVGAPDLAFAEAAKGASKPSAAKPKSSSKSSGKPSGKSRAAAKPKKGGSKHSKVVPRKPGSEPGEPDEATRRIIAGTAGGTVRESEELRAMRELDMALFPSMSPSHGQPWLAAGTPLLDQGAPQLEASGMPPSPLLTPPVAEKAPDLSWLRHLNMPDIPVRWDARVIRYLEYYKNTSRGRSMVKTWIRKSGRYGGAIRRVLREQGLPEDLLWLALVESGFDPTIRSPVGAAGLWQFMPEGARIYGLTVDRWVDERLDPERSTLAAARYLADLHKRFGTWELAFAAYNMGYGGLLASIRKYNTNDFWELSRLESGMPYETALYVPKIVAMAIVSRNKAIFGCDEVELDPAINFDNVAIGAGVSLRSIALAAGASLESVESLNPQLLAKRAPPLDPGAKKARSFTVRVPPGTGARVAKGLSKVVEEEGKLQRYRVRWGETLDDIAATRKVNRSTIMSLNGLQRHEVLRPGTVIFVPAAPGMGTAVAANVIAEAPANKPVVVVPDRAFSYPTRRRVFYRVVSGDSVRDIARIFGVKPDEIGMWNMLEPSAALHEGMTLQVYVPKGYDAERVLALDEANASVITAGSPEFFAHFEGQRGRTRLELVAKEGDNWRSIAKRHGLSVGQVERINQRSRSSSLNPGDKYVVYVPIERVQEKPSVDEKTEGPTVVASADADAEAKPAEENGTTPAVYRKVLETDDDKSDEKAAENKPGHELPPSDDKAAEKKDEKADEKKADVKPGDPTPTVKAEDAKAEKKAEAKPAATAEVKKADEKKADEKKVDEKKADEKKVDEKKAEKKPEQKPAEPKDADKEEDKGKVVQPADKGAAAKTL